LISAIWRLKSPLQSPARHTNYAPCRGEFIRLSISRIRGYCDISSLATEVAPTKYPTRPTTALHTKKKPTHHETLNHKNKKTERKFGFFINPINTVNLLVNG
jgi:hypothetical protein